MNAQSRIDKWLLPKGFVKVFENHPNASQREFHYSKEGVRIICIFDPGSIEGDYYFLREFFLDLNSITAAAIID